jgi:hypothetical protein
MKCGMSAFLCGSASWREEKRKTQLIQIPADKIHKNLRSSTGSPLDAVSYSLFGVFYVST